MIWKKAYLETRILSANPVELINILYEYAALGVQDARGALASGDIPGRARAVSKVIAIVGELESSLDHQQGGEIAANLAKLYRYIRERLTQANLDQTDRPLAEVEALLKTLGEGWQQISQGNESRPPAANDAWTAKAMPGWSAAPLLESMTGHSTQSWSF